MPDVGWFGKFELEGMAMGIPVIGYVADHLYEKLKPPIFLTTKNTFKNDLQSLLEDSTQRESLAKRGLEYVKQNHSSSVVAKMVEDSYDLISKKSSY